MRHARFGIPPYAARFTRSKLLAVAPGVLLAGLMFITLYATCGDMGWTWDEVYYYKSSKLQIGWARDLWSALAAGDPEKMLSREVIDSCWLENQYHNPHPPLYKILSSCSLVLLRGREGDLIAYRTASMLMACLLGLCLFSSLNRRVGLLPALYAGLALLCMPRFFGHAHLAATETPLAVFWFLCYWACERGLTRLSGSVLAGIFFGCALATKFTAVLIPGGLLLWAAAYRDRRSLGNMLFLLLLGPLVAVLVNPGWWHGTLEKVGAFVSGSLMRQETIPISTFFLGKHYPFSPPWYYAPFMLAVTLPIPTIFTIMLGCLRLCRQKFRPAEEMLFVMNIPVILVVVMLPGTPVHDGVRQFFVLLPFLAYLAGMGLQYFMELLSGLVTKPRALRALSAAALLILLVWPGYELYQYHPYTLSYYNGLTGGLRGAVDRGMEITYWLEPVNKQVIDVLNERLPDGARVGVWPPNTQYYMFLQERGLIKQSLVFFQPDIGIKSAADDPCPQRSTPNQPVYLLLVSRLSAFTRSYWHILTSCRPVFSVELTGVPLVSMYQL